MMNRKTIMKSLAVAIALMAGTAQVNAQEDKSSMFGIANRIGIGVGAGTEGIGIDLSTPLTKYVQARIGVNIMPDISVNTTATATIQQLNSSEKIDIKGGIDAYITGDAKHNDFLDAAELGLSLFAAGHYETETVSMPVLMSLLKKEFPDIEYAYLESSPCCFIG